MSSSRLILLSLGLFLLTTLSVLGIVIVIYFVIPSNFTFTILAGLFGSYMFIVMIFYLIILGASLADTTYDGKLVDQQLSSTTKDISGLESFLKERNFNFVATIENKYPFQPPYRSFVFLNEYQNIVAQISHIDDDSNSHLSLSTYWENQNYVETQTSDPDGINIIPNVVSNSNTIYSLLPESPEEVYRVHIHNIKEMKETAGQPIEFLSPEMILEREGKMFKIFSPILYFSVLKKQSVTTIKYATYILGVAIFFAVTSLLWDLLPETESIRQIKSILLFVFTALLALFFVFAQNQLISKKKKEKNKSKTLNT